LDTHFVLGEGSGLVRANFVSVAHRFRRVQFTHKVILFKHLSNRVSKGDGDSKRKSFWHGNNNDGDSDDETACDVLDKLHIERTIVRSEGLDNCRDYDCDEGQDSNDDSELADSVCDRVKFFLERGLFTFNVH
jgi:hypothetical protein